MPNLRSAASGPISEEFIEAGGARLYVRQTGAGTPLVVLHGGPDFNHHYLLPELDELASVARLIYYDQRGRGRSSSGVDPEDVSIDSEVADLEILRKHFNLERLTLLGHSFGAVLALEYAARLPSRVAGLVLLNPAPASHAELLRFGQYRKQRETSNLQLMQELAAAPEYAAGDIDAEAKYYAVHFSAAFHDRRHASKLVARLRSHFTPSSILTARAIEDRLYRQTWLQPDYDLMQRLATFGSPALVVHGDKDVVPIECAQTIARGLRNGKLEVLQNCGHFAYMERARRVRALITSFVNQH